jgi:hypothetical protein
MRSVSPPPPQEGGGAVCRPWAYPAVETPAILCTFVVHSCQICALFNLVVHLPPLKNYFYLSSVSLCRTIITEYSSFSIVSYSCPHQTKDPRFESPLVGTLEGVLQCMLLFFQEFLIFLKLFPPLMCTLFWPITVSTSRAKAQQSVALLKPDFLRRYTVGTKQSAP